MRGTNFPALNLEDGGEKTDPRLTLLRDEPVFIPDVVVWPST